MSIAPDESPLDHATPPTREPVSDHYTLPAQPVAYVYEVRFTNRPDREWRYYGLYRSRRQAESTHDATTGDDIEGRVTPLYAHPPAPASEPPQSMRHVTGREDAIRQAVDRFLQWELPRTFGPDCGISFDGRKPDQWNPVRQWPVGTNLFTADEARAMFEHCLPTTLSHVEPVPPAPASEPAADALVEELREYADDDDGEVYEMCRRAADRIAALTAERDELARKRIWYHPDAKAMSDRVKEAERERDQAVEDRERTLLNWKVSRDRAERAERERESLRAALQMLTQGADHTRVFLTSREKMHPDGVALWDAAVKQARAALGEGQ